MEIKRGQIFYADLSPVIGSEQGGLRPVLIASNDIGNRFSPVVIVAPITSRFTKKPIPTHIALNSDCGLRGESQVLCEQLRTIDKRRLKGYIGAVNQEIISAVNRAIKISLGV